MMSEVRRPGDVRGIPDVVIERYRLGELPAAEFDRVKAAARDDESLRRRMESLDLSDQRTDSAGWLAAGVTRRLDGRHTSPWNTLPVARWLVPVAGTLLLTMIVARPSLLTPASPDRVKGPDALLAIYRQTTAGSEQLGDGSIARPGDRIRIGYKVSTAGYGVIVSVDDRGVVTVHHPGDAHRATPLTGGDVVLLNQAYELDDAPERERFYIITAPAPFDIDPIVSIIEREAATGDAATLPLPAPLAQSTFLLQKDSRP